MFQKDLRLAYLLDFYGDILDDRSKSIMCAYYEDDLSLSEIASNIGISRQGVRHLIKKAEEDLEFFETKLGLAEQFQKIDDACKKIDLIANELNSLGGEDLKNYSFSIKEALLIITENKR